MTAPVVIASAEHIAEVRSLAGSPTTAEISPSRLDGYISDAKNWVELGTGIDVDDLNINDRGYSNVRDAISFRSSVLIRYGWRDKENKAQEHSTEANRLIQTILKGYANATAVSNADSTSSVLTSTQYTTPGLNPNIDTYRSPDFGSGVLF